MGISPGGHTTWMVSADPRVKVAAPIISVCSWRRQLAHQGYIQRAKAEDHLQQIIAEHSGHAVTAEHQKAMYAWFERRLKPTR